MLRQIKWIAIPSFRSFVIGFTIPLTFYASGRAIAQTGIFEQIPPSFVAGQGLSPSHFLPPSSEPLTQPLPSNLPTALPSTPVLSGPILDQTIPPLPTEIPNQVNQTQAQPTALDSAPDPAIPVELDLRSPCIQATGDTCSMPIQRPLSPPSPWFFSANALFMNLKGQDDRIFSSSAIDPDVRLLGSSDVRMSTTGGYELGLGRYFGCGKYALNASYWGLAPSDTFANVSSLNSGALATNLPFNTTSIAAPGTFEGLFVGTTPLTEAFANSPEHRLQRNRDFHNLELNLVWFAIGGAARQSLPTSCSDAQRSGLSENPTGINAPWPQTPCRMRLNFFSGVRWFQFQDELRYSALDSFYQNDVKNDLWGIQSGVSAYFLVTPRWSLWKNVNAGIYSNRSQLDTSAGNSTTLATIVSGGSSNGNFYDYEATRNSTSLIAETSTGLAWHFRRGWTANVGYRVIGASGIATAQSQIPLDFRVPGQSTSIQADDSLILHGAIVGATYNF